MTRPQSHRVELPAKRCGNCVHCALVAYKRDYLCFHGDDVKVSSSTDNESSFVQLGSDAEFVEVMDGEEYSNVWGGRAVCPDTEVCDEWQASADYQS